MISWADLDQRPLLVAIAGPNGAGKSTFYETQLRSAGLRFLNADRLAREFDIDPYLAARLVESLRTKFVRRRESFVFETVFSDPVGDKLSFLTAAAAAGYTVVLCFIGLSRVALSEERVAMRVAKGGHDVPHEKLTARFPRSLRNLRAAIAELPHVFIYDNSDLEDPFRVVAVFEKGQLVEGNRPFPRWFAQVLRMKRR